MHKLGMALAIWGPSRARLQCFKVAQKGVWHSHLNITVHTSRSRTARNSLADDDQKWAQELEIFRKRSMQPNQLEALAKAEATADIGRVAFASEGLAIVMGINSDAPLGATVDFSCGAKGALLRWHNEKACFVLLVAGEELVGVGDGAQCVVTGVLQVVDEESGAYTKPEYELYKVPVGHRMAGLLVNHLGVPVEESKRSLSIGPPRLTLLNEQVPMQDREVISEPLMLGVKGIDVLAPLARGSTFLMVGDTQDAMSRTALDVLKNLASTEVHCIYVATGYSAAELQNRLHSLSDAGALEHTTVVTAAEGSSIGKQYVAICAALSMGEYVRNEGGAALVVVDTVESMLQVSEAMVRHTRQCIQDTKDDDDRQEATEPEAFDLVEYEGMMVSMIAAERRRFFSMLMQRSAKMHRRLGGGTLSVLMCLQGLPATGVRQNVAPSMDKYKHLSPAQKEKLAAALASRAESASDMSSGDGTSSSEEASPSYARTEIVEELMSISDGQLVLRRAADLAGCIEVDYRQSLSRMGSRAYHPALQELAPQVRLDLAQANDAESFAENQSLSQQIFWQKRAAVTRVALTQTQQKGTALPELVALLWCLRQGVLDETAPEEIPAAWSALWGRIQDVSSEALQEIEATKKLTATAQKQFQDACRNFITTQV